LFNTSGGDVGNILVFVSSSDDNRDARVEELKKDQGIRMDGD